MFYNLTNCCRLSKTKITCYLCNYNIIKNEPYVYCINCNINMHQDCYNDNIIDNDCTKCNKCKKTGAIGIDLKFVNLIDNEFV